MRMPSRPAALCGALLGFVLALPAAAVASPRPAAPVAPGGSSISLTTPGCRAQATLRAMTLEQRLGQMFMIGTTSTRVDDATARAISTQHVGGVILMGRSDLGVTGTARVSAALQSRVAAGDPPLLVAADHEGGYVQPLRGTGFTRLPTALALGALPTWQVKRQGFLVARELRRAGITVNLAPVLDTVPRSLGRANPPIGQWDRQYGYDPATVSRQGNAFGAGLNNGRVVTAVKHFPGLGLVRANTDLAADVHDTTTTATHPYLQPFRAATAHGAQMVMMSSAYYDRIDPRNPAAFSGVVMRILRRDFAWDGVIISDDMGNAAALAPWTPVERARRFISAGGDLALNVNPTSGSQMYTGILALARTDAYLRSRIDNSALRVLRVKEGLGLLGPPC